MAAESLISLKSAAERLSISGRTLARLVATGELATVTIGRRRLIRSVTLSTWLESREKQAA